MHKIQSLIVNGQFSDEMCTSIEQQKESNPLAAQQYLDKLIEILPSLTEVLPLITAIQFLTRFLTIFGQDKISPSYPHLLKLLDTKDLALSKSLTNFFTKIIKVDAAIREPLFQHYFHELESFVNNFENPTLIQEILLSYADEQPKDFYLYLNEYLVKSQTCLWSLELLSLLGERQSHKLHEIAGTQTLDTLLFILKTTPDVHILSLGVTTLTMFLPKIVASIPTLLDDLLKVLKRCLCWKLLNKEKFIPPNSAGDVNKIVEYLKQLQDLKYAFHDIRELKQAIVWLEQQQTMLVTMKCENEDMIAIESAIKSINNTIAILNNLLTNDHNLSSSVPPQKKIKPPKVLRCTIWFYIQHLYGMFPYAFFQYVNNESSLDVYLREVIKPVIRQLKLYPLFLATEQSEMSVARWRKKDPDRSVSEIISESSIIANNKKDDPWEDKISEENLQSAESTLTTPIIRKIIEVQNTLEDGIHLGGPRDPWSPENKRIFKSIQLSSPPKQSTAASTTSTSSSNKEDSSHRQILILRNELLFERYLRQQYRRRVGLSQRDTISYETDINEKQILNDKLKEQYGFIKQMKEQISTIQTEHAKSLERFQKFNEETRIKLEHAVEENRTLREERRRLLNDIQIKHEQNQTIQTDLDTTNKRIFELEAQVHDLSSKRMHQEDYKNYLLSLREELVHWCQKYQETKENVDKSKEAISMMQNYKDTIANLNTKLDSLMEENTDFKRKWNESEERLQSCLSEIENYQNVIETQKRLLQSQQMSSSDKLKASEEKYANLKHINTGLEKRLFALEVNLHKAQGLLKMSRRDSSADLPPTTKNPNLHTL